MKTINPTQPRVKHSDIDTQVRQKPGLFMYHKETETISAEASTLSIHCRPSYAVCSIINIINPKTGGEMAFMLTEFQRCPDNDIQAFIYMPCQAAAAAKKGVKKLIIFND